MDINYTNRKLYFGRSNGIDYGNSSDNRFSDLIDEIIIDQSFIEPNNFQSYSQLQHRESK